MFSVFFRCDTIFVAESLAEIGEVGISHHPADITDLHIGAQQQFPGLLHSHVFDVPVNADPLFLAEYAAEIMRC